MSGAKVSFVIGNYNGLGVLPECLDSILNQGGGEHEIIVVDDASTDGSVEMVRARYPQVTLLVNDGNRGLPHSLNRGARASSGAWVAFLNNDVVLGEGWLESMLAAVDTWSDAVLFGSHLLFYSDRRVINSTGGMMNLAGYAWDRDIYEREGGRVSSPYIFFPCGAAMLAKREFLEEAGPFDEKLRAYYEDVELGWRAHLLGYRAVYVPRARAYHHFSLSMGSFSSRKVYLAERNRIRLMAKYFQSSTLRSCWPYWWRLYFLRLGEYWRDTERGAAERLGLAWRMLLAPAWNLVHARSLLRERRKWAGMRRKEDRELLHEIMVTRLEVPSLRPSPLLQDYRPRLAGEVTGYRDGLVMGPGDEANLGEGWHRRETAPDGTRFRWSGERAVAFLRPRKKAGRLRIKACYGPERSDARLAVSVNGSHLGELAFRSYPATCELAFPEPVGGLLEITLEARMDAAAESPPGGPARGFAIARLELRR
ncbi:MAG: glycosyltransferase family 2 protein [Actinobacteria bacterium]|nr:glycosyltransferase family 2 protein [Actinomycetota bacterium]